MSSHLALKFGCACRPKPPASCKQEALAQTLTNAGFCSSHAILEPLAAHNRFFKKITVQRLWTIQHS